MNTYIYTFGCKVNQVESEKIINEAASKGFCIVDDVKDADIVILNSCAVTERAEKKFRSMIKKLKSAKPSVIIAATGCAAEKDKEKLKSFGTDIVVTNAGKMDVLTYIAEKTDYLTGVFEAENFVDAQNIHMATKTRAFLKIQDGCDSNCSYCIIPSLRGKPKSRPLDSIVEEVKELVRQGYKEIVPVGIHVGKYGIDLDDGVNFATLVKEMVSIDGDFRIRLTSVEVNEVTDDLIELFVDNQDKICRHYHIPLQSGSTYTLEQMNRHYSAEEYISKLNRLKESVPDCTLGADVIVGFPGESDVHFEETLRTVKNSGLDHLHVFSYSDRSGTVASERNDKVPSKVKSERAKKLRAVGEEIKKSALERCVGKTYKVLTQKDNTGITDNYFTIRFKQEVESNMFLDVKVTYVNNDGTLNGEIV
jgi:threonylcarbamoyladenosine tRNA methylthiotransferase MtaB